MQDVGGGTTIKFVNQSVPSNLIVSAWSAWPGPAFRERICVTFLVCKFLRFDINNLIIIYPINMNLSIILAQDKFAYHSFSGEYSLCFGKYGKQNMKEAVSIS